MRHDQTSYKRGFGCVTEHKLPIQLILVVWPTLDEEIEDMACKKNEKDGVMPVITVADIHLRKCQ